MSNRKKLEGTGVTTRARHESSWVRVGVLMYATSMMVASFGQRVLASEETRTDASSAACTSLAGLKLSDVQLVSASVQPAGEPVRGVKLDDFSGNSPGGIPLASLPAFCRVIGSIHPEPGSEIGFEVWMPSINWDGRLHGVGIGGFAGYIDYLPLSLAVKAGQAAVATDTGHKGAGGGWRAMQDSAWARGHAERVRDYGWRGIHLSTVAAKQLAKAFYGRSPDHSYFVGCSGGGRQGLVEAGRFPEDYDGILSGAPAASFAALTLAMTNVVQAQEAPGTAIRSEQASFIEAEVLKQCDAIDGQIDGLVDDPRECKLDASKLACGASQSPQCLTPLQLEALSRIYAGPRNRSGQPLTPSYLAAGSEAESTYVGSGWQSNILTGPSGPPNDEVLVDGILRNLVPRPFATPATFDFTNDLVKLETATSKDIDARPDLRRFFNRGGKLILWHGWADAAIPPGQTLQFYDRMLRSSGAEAQSSTRLFMVPGVQHCMAGNGPSSFGQLNAPQVTDTADNSMVAALEKWVESNRRPESIVGRRGMGGALGIPLDTPEHQRLICAWPTKSVLRQGGNPDDAASYSCIAKPKVRSAASTR